MMFPSRIQRKLTGLVNVVKRQGCAICGSPTSIRRAYGRPFAHCKSCDFIAALDFVPSKIEQGMGFEGSWSGPGGGGYREYFLTRMLFEELGMRRFLLYGTGNTITFERLLEEGVDVSGADIDPNVVAYKQSRHGTHKFFHTDALPANATFDAVIAVEVFEHFHEPIRSIQSILRSLSHGGLVCGTTNFYFGGDIADGNRPGYMSHAGHVAYWSRESLANATRADGYSLSLFELVRPGSVLPDEKYGQLWPNKRVFFIYKQDEHGEFFEKLEKRQPILPIDQP